MSLVTDSLSEAQSAALRAMHKRLFLPEGTPERSLPAERWPDDEDAVVAEIGRAG